MKPRAEVQVGQVPQHSAVSQQPVRLRVSLLNHGACWEGVNTRSHAREQAVSHDLRPVLGLE